MSEIVTASESFPPLNYALSPYTGWARQHWEALLARLTYGYVCAAERNGSPARALYPDDWRGLPDSVDALESFARIAPAWAAWLHNPTNPTSISLQGRQIDLAQLLSQALLDGTNPEDPYTYWGEMADFSQHIVEAADIALALWLSRERVFARMTPSEQAQIITWLSQVDGKRTYNDNWILFPAIAMAVRLRLGYPAFESDLDSRLGQINAFYRGDGWYADGPGDEFELYNPWMFGWHYLLWAWIDGDRRPDVRDLVLRRARSFLAGFQYFFGANGSYPAWGRSIVYRFSAISTFATGYLLGVAPPNPGLLRRISSGCIRYFYQHGFIHPEEHYILQGYHGHFPQAGESYISPGSPYWACHGLFALTFDRQDPFWTATESPLPVEQADFDLALPSPGFVLRGRRSTGQVLLLNSRSELMMRFAPRHDYPSKYGKLAYSTHFPFNVAPVPGSYVPDAMIALTQDGVTFGHRGATQNGGAIPGMMWCEFTELVGGQPQMLRLAVILWKDLQLRLAFIQPDLVVRAFDSPGALGCECAAKIIRRSNPQAGWEYAEVDGRALGIRRLLGYDGQYASAPFMGYSNINLAYRYSEQPVVCELTPSSAGRLLCAVSLLRPASFDPDHEFAGFDIIPLAASACQATLPNGELVYVGLGEEAASSLLLGDFNISGANLRLVHLRPDGGELCGMGIREVDGIVNLSSPGAIHILRRASGEALVTTDTGLALSDGWLGGVPQRVEVQALDGRWIDVTSKCAGASIPAELVREWSGVNERTSIVFRITT
jgi:hypothetical protein